MPICFQMNPEGCPDIRHPGRRLIDVQAAPEHSALMKFTVEPICEDPVLFAHRLQAVSSDKKISAAADKTFFAFRALNEAAERLSRQTVDRSEGVMATIAFIQRHIRYDAGLARDYDQGLCEGLSLEEAWTLGQGPAGRLRWSWARSARRREFPCGLFKESGRRIGCIAGMKFTLMAQDGFRLTRRRE